MGCSASDQKNVIQPGQSNAPIRATGQSFPIGTPPRTKQNNSMVIDTTLIERFIKIQAEVDQYDSMGIFDALMIAEEEVENLRKQKATTEISYKVLCEKTKKEKLDFDAVTKAANIGSFFKDAHTQNKLISKEEQEFINAIHEEEISLNSLKTITQQWEDAKKKLEEFRKTNNTAIKLNDEIAFILSSCYEGPYGSLEENRLENEVLSLGEQKNILQKALHKWSNARFLLVYAYNQLVCSEDRWKDVIGASDNSRVLYATEVRNNLLAANQNLTNIRNYLTNVDIPYCTDDYLVTLSGVSQNIYEDMLTAERQHYVLEIVEVLRKRCASLCQWMDQVIKQSIKVEFQRIKADYETKLKQLRQERINLMQAKIKEVTGKSVQIKIRDFKVENNDMDMIDFDPVPNKALQSDGKQSDMSLMDIKEKPVSIGDLPPPPSRDQILGNVEVIKQKYRQHVDEMNKNLEANKREADERLQKMLEQYD